MSIIGDASIIEDGTLKNPLMFDDNWDLMDDKSVGNDNLKIFIGVVVERIAKRYIGGSVETLI